MNTMIPFLASLIVRARTKLNDTISLDLARYLRSNCSVEDSELYEALRIATECQDEIVVRLFQRVTWWWPACSLVTKLCLVMPVGECPLAKLQQRHALAYAGVCFLGWCRGPRMFFCLVRQVCFSSVGAS